VTQRLIRWLHLSDFHVGKDDYAQRRLFDKIIEHVRRRLSAGEPPDFVFITGDLANKGLPQEYEEFCYNFLLPLQEVIGSGIETRTFVVPGNHDVNRLRNQAFSREEISDSKSRYLDPTGEGKALRSLLTPRFEGFTAGDLTGKKGWIETDAGAFAQTETCREVRVGIVGVNTAWLSKDDHDEHVLTPGKSLLEGALSSVEPCDIRFVLGHHPLEWLLPQERKMISSLLGKQSAIYLHGHLHEAWAEPTFGSGHTFLAVQCGAAFQAREKEKWRNGLLFGEADIETDAVRLQPWNWNATHQDWSLAADAFPEALRKGDTWEYPRPGSEAWKTSTKSAVTAVAPAMPKGWSISTAADLRSKTTALGPEDAVRFFNGAVPDWNIALSSSIPRRTAVAELAGCFPCQKGADRTVVGVLLGPGCEGKTTVLLQAAYQLIESNPGWRVLRRVDETGPITTREILPILEHNRPCLVVVDEADRSAKEVHELVMHLPTSLKGSVHILLASRDTDWVSSGAGRLAWATVCPFRQVRLAGLEEGDARKIVGAWTEFGEHGLGDLARIAESARVKRLLDAVYAEAESSEGAFYGGLLRVRVGDDLRGHARLLLERLMVRTIPSGGKLADAFAYISAMHAEGLAFLSRPVLAEVLGCPLEKLRRDVLIPLGHEAAATTTSDFVFTRHRAVAQAVVEVLSADFGEDVEALFPLMADSAIRVSERVYVPNLAAWRYRLSQHFVEAGRRALTIRIAEGVRQSDPHNVLTLTNLAKLYRESDDSEHAERLFRNFPLHAVADRGFYHEWGTSAGSCGHHADAALLQAFSLSDQSDYRPVDNDQAKLGLAGLGVVFSNMLERSHDPRILAGLAALPVLGERLHLDSTTSNHFARYAEHAKKLGCATPPSDQAWGYFCDGVLASAHSGVSFDVLARVGDPGRLTFSQLEGLTRVRRP
jgi:predicted MPP superfamily phosphohydrolase